MPYEQIKKLRYANRQKILYRLDTSDRDWLAIAIPCCHWFSTLGNDDRIYYQSKIMGVLMDSHDDAERMAHTASLFCIRHGRLLCHTKQKLETIDHRAHVANL